MCANKLYKSKIKTAMKQKLLLLTMMLCVMVSCTTEMDDYLSIPNETTLTQEEESIITRAMGCDSLELGELVPWEPSEEMLHLKELYNEALLTKPELMAIDAEIISTPTSYDDFFSSNIYAIRELPITIKARAIASGSTSGYSYFTCSGASKEVTLGNSSTSANSKFYLKILPASTGIPYLIYSNVSKTPLCVGYYTNNPDNKILMSASNDSGSLYSASWNLLPSSSYKGYFAIQSESYMGQSNPDDMWSIFYHVLEAKTGNKIGYSQRVSNKAQQDFLISPANSFELKSVEYDLDNATITSSSMLSKVTSLTNSLEIEQWVNINVSLTANETSNYYETAGNLSLNITAPSSLKFPRPIPVANQAVLLDGTVSDAIYARTTQNISKTVNYTTSIMMKPRSLLQLTTKFKTFILNVPYVATATYKVSESDIREVKVRGSWRGYVIADPEYYLPINEPRFYDLDTGVEKNYVLEFNEAENIYIVK